MFYFLSLGSNIDPRTNSIEMVKKLCTLFGEIVIYPFAETEPEGMATNNKFLNSIAVIQSTYSADKIKEILNSIEISLGRDKNDPDSATKDRVCDIDIIYSSENKQLNENNLKDIPYLTQVVSGTLKVDLCEQGLPSINGPTTINVDSSADQIVVIDDKVYGL